METKTFVQVFIKSVEDLPKEIITLFFFNEKEGEGFNITVNPLDTGCMANLLLFDWYLKPVDLRPVGKEKPEILVKIKGDAGNYTVWGIDWLNHKMLIERACGYENIEFDKITILATELSEPKDGIKESRLSEGKISAILDSMNYETSKEREDAYDLCQILLSELASPQEEVVNPFCPYCGKYKTMQGNGIMHQLCECGVQGKEVSQSRQKSEEVAGQVTDEEIKDKSKEFINLYGYSTTLLLSEFAKWLRSRLQPAVAYNIGLQSYDNLTDLINCIKSYDKTAPLEEKGRYFEAIQRELEKIQPAQRITDEQIEKWAESQHPSMTSPIICGYVLGLMDGAKAVLSDKIAEYIKNLK